MTLPLEVFRCVPVEKGWGVRCRDFVPAGTFVACYQGELLDEVLQPIDPEHRVLRAAGCALVLFRTPFLGVWPHLLVSADASLLECAALFFLTRALFFTRAVCALY